MSKRRETSQHKIYMLFPPLRNTPPCEEERATKTQKLEPKEASASTSRARVVELQDVEVNTPIAQGFEPLDVNAHPLNILGVAPQSLDARTSIHQGDEPQDTDVTSLFESDPGLRRQIWEYPKDQRDEVRRAYLKKGPYHWSLDSKDYPLTKAKSDKQNRKFNPEWFQRFKWLEYSPSKDRAYCFPCFLFEKNSPKCKTYTDEEFKGWKRISKSKDCSFSQHVGGPCSLHNISVSSCEDLMKPSRHINNVMHVQSQEDVMKNRLLVKATIKCVRWLALQGCAFRGHDESSMSANLGNFLELLKFMAELNDQIVLVVSIDVPRNATYTSHDIQKQALHLLTEHVKKQIRQEVGDAKFCILVDEAQDNSNQEQIAIILRFVDDDGLVREQFFAIVGVEDTNASTLKKEIFDALAHYDLNTSNLRGQGYDGASNMRGACNELQALVSKECPQAYYVHCFAHRLQLALVGASNDVHEVWLFFSKLSSIVNFVNVSPKRKGELETLHKIEVKKMIDSGELSTRKGANQMTTMQKGGATRWSSHFSSVCGFIVMFSVVGKFLEDISKNGSPNAILGEAKGGYIHMRSFEFIFLLHLMQKIMGITNVLCKTLQDKSQDILNAMGMVSNAKRLLQEMRMESWQCFLKDVVSFCTKHGVIVPDMNAPYTIGSGRSCQQKDRITLEHHCHFDIFIGVIEYQVMELKNRFNDDIVELLTLSSALDPHDGFRSFNIDDICRLAEKFYPKDFTHNDIDTLRRELEYYAIDVVERPEFQNIATISDLCQMLVKTRKAKSFGMINKVIRLILTLPVSTATTERAFSAMKILKTVLRNKMEGDFLGNCMVIYIEREFSKDIDMDLMIDEFDDMTDRRVKLR